MQYYQDRVTGSIYPGRELIELTKAGYFSPRELLVRFEALPEHQRCLLEETEAEVAKRRRRQHPERAAKRVAPRPKFSLPGF